MGNASPAYDARKQAALLPQRLIVGGFLTLATIGVLFWRRPDQFLNPAIWVEDGTFILKAYAERGLWSVFEPVQSYYILTSKLLALASFRISILYAPEIALGLTVAFTVAIILAIAFSPTYLPAPIFCAVAALLVPTDAEVFGVSEYSFWWAGLLLPLSLLWRSEGQWLRIIYILIGGLSSPIIIPAAALMVLRATIERTRAEIVAAAIASGVALVQLSMASGARLQPTKIDPSMFRPLSWAIGAIIVAGLIAFAYRAKEKADWRMLLLVGLLAGIVAITAMRIPLEILHPFLAGPRYFFYPFIFLTWIGIWIAMSCGWPTRVIIIPAPLLPDHQSVGFVDIGGSRRLMVQDNRRIITPIELISFCDLFSLHFPISPPPFLFAARLSSNCITGLWTHCKRAKAQQMRSGKRMTVDATRRPV